jgi:hypothetical protein
MQCGMKYEIKNNHEVVEYYWYNEFFERKVFCYLNNMQAKPRRIDGRVAQPTAQPNYFWFL